MMEWGWEGQVYGPSPLGYWVVLASVVVLTALGLALNAIILRKAGHHWLWSLLFLVPLAYVIGVWVFAWARWPRLAGTAPTAPEGADGVGGRRDGQPPYIAPDPNPRRSFSDRRRL